MVDFFQPAVIALLVRPSRLVFGVFGQVTEFPSNLNSLGRFGTPYKQLGFLGFKLLYTFLGQMK
jgi:hypothetical protein